MPYYPINWTCFLSGWRNANKFSQERLLNKERDCKFLNNATPYQSCGNQPAGDWDDHPNNPCNVSPGLDLDCSSVL